MITNTECIHFFSSNIFLNYDVDFLNILNNLNNKIF